MKIAILHWNRMGLLGQGLLVAAGAYSRVAPTERGGYHLARFVRRFVPRDQWRSRFTTPDGLMLDLDLSTYPDCCMAMGLYERDTWRQLRKLLKPGSWFVDGGANIGYFTTLAACWVGKRGRVDAFEPDPINFKRLADNASFNGIAGRVKMHPLALSDRSQELTMRHATSADANHGSSGLYAAGDEFAAQAVRLDEFLAAQVADGRVPDVIKLDVEGSEMAALRGMSGLLSVPNPPVLIIEHNPQNCDAAGYRPSQVWKILLDMRPAYKMYWIGWRLHQIAIPAHMEEISRVGNVLARVGDGKPEQPPITRRSREIRMATWWRNWME